MILIIHLVKPKPNHWTCNEYVTSSLLVLCWKSAFKLRNRICSEHRLWMGLLPPPLVSLLPGEKCRSEVFSLGRVHIKIQAPWVTGNQRTCYLPQVVSTRAPEQISSRLTFTSSLSLAPLCRSHREAIELHLALCGSQPPSSPEQRGGRRRCVRSVGRSWFHGRQTNVVAWQGELRGSPVWAWCLGNEGPWGLGFL